ncbi:MAG: helix-turn-helix transcriptional regulator [Oscillospiraceae bacterium]
MERKSIGSFIAVLRKANGLTQKDLAEKLNVSDKSVSRWERDDGAPDLSLVPVIAEIFGVTCDELLRGERKAATAPSEQQTVDKAYPKTEKQRQRILSVSLSKYRNRSLIAASVAIVGLLAAMLCNFGFNRGYIGFLIGAVFYLAAGICQAICINGAFLAVSDDEMAGAEVEHFRRSVVSLGEKVISLPIVLLALSIPLIVYPRDTFMGLTAESWLLNALPFGLGGVAFCAVVCYFLTNALQKRGVYTLTEKENTVYQHNFKLKRTCTLILFAAICATLLCHGVAVGGWDVSHVATGTSFDDFDTFKAYMEQDISAQHNGIGGVDAAPTQSIPGSEHYYDEQGNEITKEQSMTRTITDNDGNVVCKFIERNQSVWSLRYGHMNGEILPITVFTQEDIMAARRRINARNAIFAGIYLLETATAFLVYFKKRTREV